MTFVIYALVDPREPDKIRYIGLTRYSIKERLDYHLWEASRGKRSHKCNWLRKLISEGVTPNLEILENIEGDHEDACEAEMDYIRLASERGDPLTNTTIGGEGHPGPMSQEAKEKIRAFQLGRKRSPETRAKMSLAQKGNQKSKGQKRSEESKERMREAQGGKLISDETRQKISRALTGRKASLETREKMREAGKKRIFSLEQREKLQVAQKARFTNPSELERQSRIAKAQWADPVARAKKTEALRASWARRKGQA